MCATWDEARHVDLPAASVRHHGPTTACNLPDILDDMMAPYVDDFVPKQLEVLAAHLSRYFPTVTPAHAVEYKLDMDLPTTLDTPGASLHLEQAGEEGAGQTAAPGADRGSAEAVSDSDGEENDADQVGQGHSHGPACPADAPQESNRSVDGEAARRETGGVGAASSRGALAWAARKGHQLSSNLQLPRRRGKARPCGARLHV